jgi:hypothetical protein
MKPFDPKPHFLALRRFQVQAYSEMNLDDNTRFAVCTRRNMGRENRAEFQLPDSDALICGVAPVKPTPGFRRLRFESLPSPDSWIIFSFPEASKTGSSIPCRGAGNQGVRIR